MDYEKAYKDALERAKKIHDNPNASNGRKEWLESIFPELKESGDEKIRKEIIDYFYGCIKRNNKSGFRVEQIKGWIAYLEKQKEQKPAIMKPHKGDGGNPYDMGVSEAQEYAIKRGFGIPFNDGEVYVDERHLTQTIGNILRWADEHPKEQKPALRLVGDGFYTDPNSHFELEGEQKPAEEELLYRLNGLMQDYIKEGNDDKEREHRFKCYQLFLDALEDTNFFEQKEQKPIHPNIEREYIEERLRGLIDKEGEYYRGAREELAHLLCILGGQPSQYLINNAAKEEQKPAEWSEEDEYCINQLIVFCENCMQQDSAAIRCANWLKSLRPSWKPSEEQIRRLNNVIVTDSGIWGVEIKRAMMSLYEDLKKLI